LKIEEWEEEIPGVPISHSHRGHREHREERPEKGKRKGLSHAEFAESAENGKEDSPHRANREKTVWAIPESGIDQTIVCEE
jgi:hypothetical protein